jgi:hypothetical protein
VPPSSPRGGSPRERLLDSAQEVAYRFRAYDGYGQRRATALRALARRAPGSSAGDREWAFDLFCRVHDVAVAAVREHPRPRRTARSRYAEFEDIDFEGCLARVDTIAPGSALPQKRGMLTMVIYWYYLK